MYSILKLVTLCVWTLLTFAPHDMSSDAVLFNKRYDRSEDISWAKVSRIQKNNVTNFKVKNMALGTVDLTVAFLVNHVISLLA